MRDLDHLKTSEFPRKFGMITQKCCLQYLNIFEMNMIKMNFNEVRNMPESD